MKHVVILFLFLFSVLEQDTIAQVSRDSAFALLKRNVMLDKWIDKEIYSAKKIITPLTYVQANHATLSPNYKSWFFFIDEMPYANWAHPCKYVFIDTFKVTITTMERKMPPLDMENMDLLHGVRPLNKTNPDSLFRIPNRTNPRNISTTENEYAIIISGGYCRSSNWERYWNDCSAMYKALVNVYSYDKSKIFVLFSDGTDPGFDLHLNNDSYVSSPLDLDGDGTNDIQYAATISNITRIFDSLSYKVTSSDNVFIFITDHGDEGSLIYLWNQQIMTANQFAVEVNKLASAKTINICMEQCFSGGYTSTLAGERRVIATACAADEPSRPMRNFIYDEFCFHWISAVVGETPSGTIVNADYDNDGFVSMIEAFVYAMSNDYFFLLPLNNPQHETPQYYSNPSCLGGSLVLNGVFDNTCLRNDLYIRDTATDDGSMPSSCYSTWDSPDIWMETLDGQYVAHPHGNTKYAVCVKIHNRRDVASSGTEKLFLNWAKAGANDQWYEYWTGDNPLPCCAPKGGVIGSATGRAIPSIPANSYRIDTIHWITPAGETYAGCTDFNYNQWHFCLLARIHDDDVIAHEDERFADVHSLVRDHNNVAQQNVYLDSADNYQKTFGLGNANPVSLGRTICLVPKVFGNISITDYAEVYITLDAGLLMAINSANITGLTWVNGNTLRWNGGNACIPVTLPANSYYTLQTTVNFLADQIPASSNFDFDIVLRNANGDSILGGEHYKCVRTNGRYFQASFTCNTNVLLGNPITLAADDINEDADYSSLSA